MITGVDRLTPAEITIANLRVSGKSIDQIAEQLGRGQGTIKCHIQHIYHKLNIKSVNDLAVILEAYNIFTKSCNFTK